MEQAAMSQPIKCNVILNSVRTRRDNSLTLSLETPELTDEHMLVFLKLRNINLDMTLEPLEDSTEAPAEVKSQIKTKTASQRLRAVLFVLFNYEKGSGTVATDALFEPFYEKHMNLLIDFVKRKLPETT